MGAVAQAVAANVVPFNAHENLGATENADSVANRNVPIPLE